MKIIIDIDDNVYDDIEHNKGEYINTLNWAVRNGTPVSNEGDLISRSELKKAFNKWWGCDDIPATVVEDLIDTAPTVEFSKEICSACGRYIREKGGAE